MQELERRHLDLVEVTREQPRHGCARRGLIVVGDFLAQRRLVYRRNAVFVFLFRLLHFTENFRRAAGVAGEMGFLEDAHAPGGLEAQEILGLAARGLFGGNDLVDRPPAILVGLNFKGHAFDGRHTAVSCSSILGRLPGSN